MSLTKLTCPECSTTMRPKSPVAPGKKVRCPKCETVFVARDDVDEVDEVDEVEEAPRKKKAPAKAAAGKSKDKNEPKPKKKESEESETYGYIKEEEPDEEESEAKKINYAPDESIRDLRGPAIVKLRTPANYLTLCGFIGAGGWLIFILLMAIPFCFPIVEEKPPVGNHGQPLEDAKKGGGSGKSTFHIWWNLDFYNGVINNWGGDKPGHPGIFWAIMLGFGLLFVYSGLIAFGAIKLVNMESRTWGLIASGMAMLPHTAGLTWSIAFGIQFALRQIEIDEDSINYLTIGIGVVLWLASVALGVWTMIVANDPIVKEGYEYEPE
jgi:predicted Zn finger-like uncharacterized protein